MLGAWVQPLYLGRGRAGGHLPGTLDEVRFHRCALGAPATAWLAAGRA